MTFSEALPPIANNLDIRQPQSCPCCHSEDIVQLKSHFDASMRSDGIVVNTPLTKYHCMQCNCGIGSNLRIYAAYRRTDGSSVGESARHRRVAQGLFDIIRTRSKLTNLDVLEVGAANLETSSELARLLGGQVITAIDPYPENESRPENVLFHKTTLEDYGRGRHQHDVIFSNHVIEHFSDPVEFFSLHRNLLKAEALLIVCCPNSSMPSVELLFSDHRVHLTASAISSAAAFSGLSLKEHFLAPWDDETSVSILGVDSHSRNDSPWAALADIRSAREKYFADWTDCQTTLMTQAKLDDLVLFGAGEFSQLIACYMPDLYRRILAIVVEDLDGARNFDKPVRTFDYRLAYGQLLMLGLHRRSRKAVLARLQSKGVAIERILVPSRI